MNVKQGSPCYMLHALPLFGLFLEPEDVGYSPRNIGWFSKDYTAQLV
jgi:hypothetical protein